MYQILYVILLFIIYSIIGYIVEVTAVSLKEKKLNFNRGFLIGPYIPIYGTGIMLIIGLLSRFENNLIILFILSTAICTILEYITSYIMEKMYKLRWWDYSDKKININGRVCLSNSLLFGLGGLLIIKLVNPTVEKIISFIPETILIFISIILLLAFITDLVISIWITYKLEINVNKYINKDATEAIKKEITKLISSHTYLIPRIIDAFPNLKTSTNKELKFINEIIANVKKETKRLKEEINKLKEEYKDNKELLKEKIEELKTKYKK